MNVDGAGFDGGWLDVGGWNIAIDSIRVQRAFVLDYPKVKMRVSFIKSYWQNFKADCL